MNFVDPKEYDIPGLVRKNRYRTILPSEYLLPQGGEELGSCHLGRPKSRARPLGMVGSHHSRRYGDQANPGREGMVSRDWLAPSLALAPALPG